MASRLDIIDMQAIALMMGGKCLSKEYWDDDSPLMWRCDKGHNWDAPYTIIAQGGWCMQCAKEEIKQEKLAHCQELALEKGGLCLSTVYVSNKSKLKWQCGNGHKWTATPAGTKKGKWCIQCRLDEFSQSRLKIFQAKAKAKGGVCLSETYKNVFTKLAWQCSKGHEWKATPEKIEAGLWCPECSAEERSRVNLEWCQNLVKSRGGMCLSTVYVNRVTKLKWQCAEGHEWMMRTGSIIAGAWCELCRIEEFGQTQLKRLRAFAKTKGGICLSETYGDNYTKLEWQCKKGHRWKATPINITSAGLWCPKCSREEKQQEFLKHWQQLAKRRGGQCLSTVYVDAHANLKWQCAKGHQWFAAPGDTQKGRWCTECKRDEFNRKELKELQAIAKKKGGVCLSESYTNADTKLLWQCKEGHEWKSDAGNIKSGRWCPHCVKRFKHTIEDLQKKAAEHGGKCLSTEYENSLSKIKWQCAEGHKWIAVAGSVYNGRWCQKCYWAKMGDRTRGTLEEYIKIAEAHGGKLLTKKYHNSSEHLKWRCAKGHIWEAQAAQVKHAKSWCPRCKKNFKHTIEFIQGLAKKRGGKCLSEKYEGNKVKLKWQCKKGHEWMTRPEVIIRGGWCRECYDIDRKPRSVTV